MTPVLSGFEDLLPLLIFLGLWWMTSRKKKQPPAPPPVPPKGKASQPTLAEGDQPINPLDVLRQMLLGDMETPRPMERKPRLQQPDEPMADEYVDRFDRHEEWAGVSVAEPVTRKQEPVPGQIREEKREALARRIAAPSKPEQTILLRQPPAPRFHAVRHMSRRNLRKAVIWSEILAPPVGMREG